MSGRMYFVIFNTSDKNSLSQMVDKLKFLAKNRWARISDNSYMVICSNTNVEDICERFHKTLNKDEEVMVMDVTGSTLAWKFTSGRQRVTDWIKDYFGCGNKR